MNIKKNLPNYLTILRGILTVFIIPLFFISFKFQFETIYILFLLASLSDFFDGYLARKWKTVSDFGKMFDPLFDKILTIVLYVLLAPFGIIPTWIFAVLIMRELIVDGMKNFMLSKGVITPAILTGKLKLVFQILFLNTYLLVLIFPEQIYLNKLLWSFAIIAIFFAYISGYTYTKKFIRLFKK